MQGEDSQGLAGLIPGRVTGIRVARSIDESARVLSSATAIGYRLAWISARIGTFLSVKNGPVTIGLVGIEREDCRKGEYSERNRGIFRDDADDGKGEYSQRDGTAESESIEVDDRPQPRTGYCHDEGEGNANACGGDCSPDQMRISLDSDGRVAGREAGQHAEGNDDTRPRQVVIQTGAGRRGSHREDDQRREALENHHIEYLRDRWRRCGDHARTRDDDDTDPEDDSGLLAGCVIHLREDDRNHGTAAENEQANLEDAGSRIEATAQDHRDEDAIEQWETHHDSQQPHRTGYPTLDG